MNYTYQTEIWTPDYDCVTITCRSVHKIIDNLDQWLTRHHLSHSQLGPSKIYRSDGALTGLIIPETRQIIMLHRQPCAIRAYYLRLREVLKQSNPRLFLRLVQLESIFGLISLRIRGDV